VMGVACFAEVYCGHFVFIGVFFIPLFDELFSGWPCVERFLSTSKGFDLFCHLAFRIIV